MKKSRQNYEYHLLQCQTFIDAIWAVYRMYQLNQLMKIVEQIKSKNKKIPLKKRLKGKSKK